MLGIPIEWTDLVAQMNDFASIPVVPAVITVVAAISLVVFLAQKLMELVGGWNA